MRNMKQTHIDLEAQNIRLNWICRYGTRNAEKLSLAVRRTFRKVERYKACQETK